MDIGGLARRVADVCVERIQREHSPREERKRGESLVWNQAWTNAENPLDVRLKLRDLAYVSFKDAIKRKA